MKILAIIVLLAVCAGAIKSGWVLLLFPAMFLIFFIIKSDKNSKSMDSFFALMFFAALVAIAVKAIG